MPDVDFTNSQRNVAGCLPRASPIRCLPNRTNAQLRSWHRSLEVGMPDFPEITGDRWYIGGKQNLLGVAIHRISKNYIYSNYFLRSQGLVSGKEAQRIFWKVDHATCLVQAPALIACMNSKFFWGFTLKLLK